MIDIQYMKLQNLQFSAWQHTARLLPLLYGWRIIYFVILSRYLQKSLLGQAQKQPV